MRARAIGAALLAAMPLAAVPAAAQGVQQQVESLAWDRPETWAMRYFTSATLLGGFLPQEHFEPGSLRVGAEGAWIPRLSTAQSRVGFDGTKEEDLNKVPVLFRPRVTVGLPAGFGLTVAWIPPVRAFGVKADLFAAAVEHSVHEWSNWSLGARLFAQTGSAEAAFTCPQQAAAAAPGSAANPFGCLAASQDVATLRYVGAEVGAGRSEGRVQPHASVATQWLQNRFQVDAQRFDVAGQDGTPTAFLDRHQERSQGFTFSFTAGLGFQVNDRLQLAGDLFYTPLLVRRSPGAAQRNDGLLNVRALVVYRIR